MSNGRRLSRGDNRRNARLARLRGVLSHEHGVLALDLADDKQVFALTDQCSRVLARKTVRCRPWQLAEAIEWGGREALAAGFTGVTLACEPTGHRWKVVNELATIAGIQLVCVQPLLVVPDVQARPSSPGPSTTASATRSSPHLSIVFAALAVTRLIEERTGWSIKRFVRTARSYRTVEIRVGEHLLTAEDPLPDELRDALALINCERTDADPPGTFGRVGVQFVTGQFAASKAARTSAATRPRSGTS